MEQHDPTTATGAGAAPDAQQDVLLGLRAALESVDELPLDERAEVFERTHGVVVRELRALELG